MSTFLEKTVLVTGGASGIGRLIAEKSLKAGANNIILWVRDKDALIRLSRSFEESGSRFHIYQVDVSRPDEISIAAEMTLDEIGPVDILFNNAGIVIGKEFHHYTREEIRAVIEVNVLGMMHTTSAFLPQMIERGSGHIVNISSAAGLIANPKMSVYAASKWAVTGWSESLRLELESMGKDLHVTTIQSSYIKTGMFEGVKAPFLTPLLEPDYIAGKIMSTVKRNRITLREPFMVKLIPFLKGILPARVFDLLAGRLFGVYRSMDTFTGRSDRRSTNG